MTKRSSRLLKTLSIIYAIAILACFYPQTTARADAESSWARVVKDNVNLFTDETLGRVMFTLEKSYYVKIISEQDNTLFVSVTTDNADFPTICGYVRRIEAELCELPPLSPVYPTVRLTVTSDSAQFKLLPLPSAENVIVAVNGQKLNYYGEINSYGTTWYYVYAGGRFGYVEKGKTSAPQIELHPTPIVKDEPVFNPDDPNEPEKPEDKKDGMTPAAEILLIVFVVLLAVGLTLALFLPGNLKKSVFDQDI